MKRLRESLASPWWMSVGLVMMLAACGQPQGGPPPGMKVPVVGYAAQRQPVTETISLVGSLAANEAVDIKSEIDGTIDGMYFDEGQRVEAGQQLFTLDQRKLKATLEEAKANLQLAEATRARFERLVANGAVSQQELDQAVATYDASAAAVALTEARLNDAAITAPFEGVMGARMVSVGQYISAGAKLSSLINQDPIKAEFSVPERFLREVKVGQAIELTVAAYPGETFTGEVYFIDPQIDETTRTALVKARIPNGDGRLRRGMFANLALITEVRQDALVIPESALVFSGERVIVYVVDQDQLAQLRPVTTGMRLPGKVEIVSGVEEGEVVVIEGVQKLRPGAPVAVKFPGVSSDAPAASGAPAPAQDSSE